MAIQRIIIERTDKSEPSEHTSTQLADADQVFLIHGDNTITVWKDREGEALSRLAYAQLPSRLQLAIDEGSKTGWGVVDQFEFSSPSTANSGLARALLDRGLLFLVNDAVLHHYGFALGVDLAEDGVSVKGLAIYRSNDPEGIRYDDQTLAEGREKLRRAGYR